MKEEGGLKDGLGAERAKLVFATRIGEYEWWFTEMESGSERRYAFRGSEVGASSTSTAMDDDKPTTGRHNQLDQLDRMPLKDFGAEARVGIFIHSGTAEQTTHLPHSIPGIFAAVEAALREAKLWDSAQAASVSFQVEQGARGLAKGVVGMRDGIQ